MNRSNIDITVYNGRDCKLHVNVVWGNDKILNYAITPKDVGDFTTGFSLCDIKPYVHGRDGVTYILMLSSMYLLINEHHDLLDCMVSYRDRPNVVYGMCAETAPFSFAHNDTFNATLAECEAMCVGDPIDLVERSTDNVIIMKCEAMKELIDMYIPDNKMLVHIRN